MEAFSLLTNNSTVCLNYDLSKDRSINLLYDYSNFLRQNRIIDDKIIEWQTEKADLFNKFGVEGKAEVEGLIPTKIDNNNLEESEDEFFKLKLEAGNYGENEILKNLLTKRKNKPIFRNGAEKYLLKRKRKLSENDNTKIIKSRPNNINFEIVNTLNNNEETSEMMTEFKLSLSNSPRNANVRNKKADSNRIIKNIITFNDEAFENLIKEFLNIDDFPSEPKDKVSLLRKFISVYKKVKADKIKLTNFTRKISEKLKEPIEEIQSLFEFEYLRNKREGAYTNLSKFINKFSSILVVNKITDIRNFSILTENNLVKDKYLNFLSKITEYINAYKEIYKFFEKDFVGNNKLIKKFIPTFKLSRFFSEEGPDKIVKKIKEIFDKNKILYEEDLFLAMVPNDQNEVVEHFKNFDKEITEVDKILEIENARIINETEFIKDLIGNPNSGHFVNDSNNFSIIQSITPIRSVPVKIESPEEASYHSDNLNSQFALNDNKENSISQQNNYSNGRGVLGSKNANDFTISNYILYTINEEGFKFPVKSNQYLLKQFDKSDFPPDELEQNINL